MSVWTDVMWAARIGMFSKVVIWLQSELTLSVDASPFAFTNFYKVLAEEFQAFRRNIRFCDYSPILRQLLNFTSESITAKQKLVRSS